MDPKAHRTLLPGEVRFAWPAPGAGMSSRMCVTVWLDVLRWATVTGRMQLPHGDSLR
jgi:hypothetical protein